MLPGVLTATTTTTVELLRLVLNIIEPAVPSIICHAMALLISKALIVC